jgi:transcriptional regulator
MYVPAHFKEDRVDELHAMMHATALGTLVIAGPGGFEASHVPMLIDPEPGPYGTLRGHVARANPQWRDAGDAKRPAVMVQALAMFLGPNAYITPNWYATKKLTGKVVPTWNYTAVHAHGAVTFFDDRDRLLDIVTRLTNLHEGRRTAPWAVSDAPADYIETMLKAIVGFELPIARLEGKWKLGQNRSAEDYTGVREGLEVEGAALSDVMAARSPR